MLITQTPSNGLIFFSILYREDLFEENFFKKKLAALYGDMIVFKPQNNPLVEYYTKEMGAGLTRVFFVSSETYPREYLLSTKLKALEWENELAQDSKRMANIDTGLISPENFILATTKNYSHRVYLGQNIFADLTYQCVNGSFESLPWTYPDYVDLEKLEFLNWCRNYLLMQGRVKTL